MHEGRIAHCEPDETWRRIIEDSLEGTPHRVVASASSAIETSELLDRIAAGEVDANLVILTRYTQPAFALKRIRELGLPVRTMLLSGNSAKELGVEGQVDSEVFKPKVGLGLAAHIDTIQEPEAPQK